MLLFVVGCCFFVVGGFEFFQIHIIVKKYKMQKKFSF